MEAAAGETRASWSFPKRRSRETGELKTVLRPKRVLGKATIINPLVLLALALSTSPVIAEGECRKCIAEKLEGLGEKVALGALLGAAGGASGLLPGAACGAVLGAAAAS